MKIMIMFAPKPIKRAVGRMKQDNVSETQACITKEILKIMRGAIIRATNRSPHGGVVEQ